MTDNQTVNEPQAPIVVPAELVVAFRELRVLAECFDDTQKARIACGNRVGSGEVDPLLFTAQTEALENAEHVTELMLVRRYRSLVRTWLPGIEQWQVTYGGLGEKLVARLLGHLGHPKIATPSHFETKGGNRVQVFEEPYERLISQLWSYCGHGDPERKLTKGMTQQDLLAMGNPRLKMLVHLLAEASIKNPGKQDPKYRKIYEHRRDVTATRVHAKECKRCGPSGKPALINSPWSKAHQHADALRIVGKEMLRDLWIAS